MGAVAFAREIANQPAPKTRERLDKLGVLARRPAGEQVLPVCFQPGEEGGVAEQAVFGDLGIAGAELASGQRVEQRAIGDHHDRLMEGADQVLALGRINAGLAADRGVDLRQQCGGHLHEVQPAPDAGGCETGEVADNAAAESDDEVAALDTRGDDRLAHRLECGIALGGLAFRHNDARGLDGRRSERGLAGRKMMARDRLVGDERNARARPQRLDALYVSLYTYLNGAADWTRPPQQYTYKAPTGCGSGSVAQITSPTPGGTLSGRPSLPSSGWPAARSCPVALRSSRPLRV